MNFHFTAFKSRTQYDVGIVLVGLICPCDLQSIHKMSSGFANFSRLEGPIRKREGLEEDKREGEAYNQGPPL